MPTQWIQWARCRGRNGWDAPQDIPLDMAAEAQNVHFYEGGLASKRGGSTSTGTLTGATGPFKALTSWVPGQDETDRELFLVDSDSPINILRLAGGSTTSALTIKDAIAGSANKIKGVGLNGKLFLPYDSTVNRLQVYDPVLGEVRRVGLATPGAPTVTNTGSGSYTDSARYYRVAWTEQQSSVTVRRSELGTASTVFTPSGSGTHARVTQPTVAGEDETHWEVYESLDDVTYYGPIATVAIGTSTYDDNGDADTIADNYDLAPVEGTNKPFPSVKYLYSNGVRLFGVGVYETSAGDSLTPQAGTVYFTPALDASSIADEERCQDTTTAVGKITLARNAGGVDTGICGLGNTVYVFQQRSIYALIPTENAVVPYRRVQFSTTVGALSHQSIVQAEDELGRPCLYFLDPELGPYRLGYDGLHWVGKDVKDVWEGRTRSSANPAHGVYHRDKRQVWFWIPTSGAAQPNAMIVLDVPEQRQDTYGDLRGGWSYWLGNLAGSFCSAMMANTLGSSMSLDLKPYTGFVTGTVLLKGDTTDANDNGTNFQAYVQSGGVMADAAPINTEVIRSYLLAEANDSVTITQTFIRNFGDETNRTDSVSIEAAGSETRVLRKFEASGLTDAFVIQVRLGDASASAAVWALDRWYAELTRTEPR